MPRLDVDLDDGDCLIDVDPEDLPEDIDGNDDPSVSLSSRFVVSISDFFLHHLSNADLLIRRSKKSQLLS